LSEAAPSVGGGAHIGWPQRAPTADVGTEAFAAQLIRRIVEVSQDLDPVGLQAQLDLAASVLGLARCVDDIVIPATRQLRRSPGTGQRNAGQDLMATEAVRTWLNHRGSFAPPPQALGPIVLACGPRDRATVDLEALALLLRFRRWPCRVLGARVSPFALTIAARAADATGVVVSSTEGRGRHHAVVSLKAIDALEIPVFFVGDAFEAEDSRRELPGRYLGTGFEGACALLTTVLTPAAQRRPAAVQ